MLEMRKGTELEGRYVVHDEIGSGGHGSVWKASDKQLGRDVALKRLLKTSIAVGSNIAEALQEARKNALVVHTNIVQVYDILEVDGEHLIVMEYVDGSSLHSLLREKAKKNDAVALDQSVGWLKDVLAGLSFAHSAGIVHRDLSPLNILLTRSGVPKIADFGIAKFVGPLDSTAPGFPSAQGGTGNPWFMAPEQARGEAADFSSDLFMVGIVGYLLLTGRHPFAHPSGLFTVPELLADPGHLPETPRIPQAMTATQQRLFREYAAVIMRLLHRERAGRFANAREAISALDAVAPTLDCPACLEQVPDHHKFCGFCGTRLDGPPDKATRPAVKSTPAASTSAEELAFEGYRLARAQRWEAAISYYRRALAADHTFVRAHWNLGFALNHIGNYAEAIDVLTKGLSLNIEDEEHLSHFYYALSYAKSNLKKYDEALADISHSLKLRPDSLRALYLRARIRVFQEDIEGARYDVSEILRLSPTHPGALRLREELDDFS